MRCIGIVYGVLVALYASVAGTVSIKSPHSSFQVEQIPNKAFGGRNGPLALVRAYEKFALPVPSKLRAAASRKGHSKAKRDSGTEIAVPEADDREFLVPVEIGTPPQTLNLVFDTGSADTWVFSSATKNGSQGHDVYRPSKSSTASRLGNYTWSINYGDNSSSSGVVYRDSVNVGDLTVAQQSIEAAEEVSSSFTESSIDGILGLAGGILNQVRPEPQKTWFENIGSELDSQVIVSDLRHDATGGYTFGTIPPEALDGEMFYTELDTSMGYWAFNSSFGLVGKFMGIVDTGTSLLLGSEKLLKAYYKQVEGAYDDDDAGGYIFKCDVDLPDLIFTIGKGEITVPGDFINYNELDDKPGYCYGGIQYNLGLPFYIFGSVALKTSYVVLDSSNSQIGFSQK